jgi:hypothetical protein
VPALGTFQHDMLMRHIWRQKAEAREQIFFQRTVTS